MMRLGSGLVLSLLLVFPRAATAECVGVDPANQLRFVTAVFKGRLVERAGIGEWGFALTFEATKVWKGTVTRRQVIYQLKSFDMSFFDVGLEYVVFANPITTDDAVRLGVTGNPSALMVLDCNGARQIGPDDAAIRRLGNGRLVR